MEVVILPLVLVAMFYLVIMPQRKQQKQQAALLASLATGDAVLTSGGIYGVITEVDGNDVFLEVANGIELRVNKSAVLRKVVDPSDTNEGK
jgi:preprotein translocase subunit YajC